MGVVTIRRIHNLVSLASILVQFQVRPQAHATHNDGPMAGMILFSKHLEESLEKTLRMQEFCGASMSNSSTQDWMGADGGRPAILCSTEEAFLGPKQTTTSYRYPSPCR